MNELDNILANTEKSLANGNGAPVILSEQNDVNQIDWQAARMDVLEMAKMGRTNVVTAAVRRANLDVSTGKVAVMVAGPAAWHKLGVNVQEAVSSEHAIQLAGQNWLVKKVPAQYQFGDKFLTAKGQFILIREDTGAALGAVGARYTPIQNFEGYKFLDTVLSDFGAKYDTAGAVHGGAKIWMQVKMPKGFKVADGDEVDTYATFVNPHDGSGKASVFATTLRAVCENTLRVALGDKGKGVGIRHTAGSIMASVQDAREALGLAAKSFDEFQSQAKVLVRTPVRDVNGYFNKVLDDVLEITQAKMELGAARLADADFLTGMVKTAEARQKAELSYAKAIERRSDILTDIIERYESERNGVGGIRGSAWAAMNAVTEHANYNKFGRQVGTDTERADRRFESVLDGPRDQMNQAALAQALALAS